MGGTSFLPLLPPQIDEHPEKSRAECAGARSLLAPAMPPQCPRGTRGQDQPASVVVVGKSSTAPHPSHATEVPVPPSTAHPTATAEVRLYRLYVIEACEDVVEHGSMRGQRRLVVECRLDDGSTAHLYAVGDAHIATVLAKVQRGPVLAGTVRPHVYAGGRQSWIVTHFTTLPAAA